MKKRKLITRKCYIMLHAKTSFGVPLTRAVKDLGIFEDITRPSVAKLLKLHEYGFKDYNIDLSLSPPWVDQDGPLVQEQPSDWVYKGYFPAGEWLYEGH